MRSRESTVLVTGGLGYIGSHVAAAIREEHGVTSVVHLAGRKSAPESVLRPAWYFQQNFGALACVLEADPASVERAQH